METAFTRILVVDDDASARAHVSKMLSYLGYTVFSTENGPKGLDFFLKNQFDLIIADLEIASMDNPYLSDQIKEKSPDTQVILVACQGKEIIQTRKNDFPVDRVLSKPFTIWEIEETIQAVLNQ